MKNVSVIEKVLARYPSTRNSDRELLLRVWEEQGLVLNNKQKYFFLNKALSAETIRRTRQKFQQKGMYPASDAVDEARFEKYVSIKDGIARIEVRETQELLDL